MKRCPVCHRPLHDDAPYCPRCRVTPEDVPPDPYVVALLLTLATAAIVIGVILLSQ